MKLLYSLCFLPVSFAGKVCHSFWRQFSGGSFWRQKLATENGRVRHHHKHDHHDRPEIHVIHSSIITNT